MTHYDPAPEEILEKFAECGRDIVRLYRLAVVEASAHYHKADPAIISNTDSRQYVVMD